MAGLSYKYITVKDSIKGKTFRVGILDQNTMYSTGNAGQANNGTIKNGAFYSVTGAALFIASGGNILRCVTGTGGGLSFSFREETTPSTNVGGYYVNGTKVCSWVEGVGGIFIVHLIRERNAASNVCKAQLWYGFGSSAGNAMFMNGHCLDGTSKVITDDQQGWGRMTKAEWANNGNVTLYANNANGGSNLYYPFLFGGGNGSSYGPFTISGSSDADPDDPYDPNGNSGETDWPPGNFSGDSDELPDELLPDESETGAIGTGFSTIFAPDKGQLQNLADVMWGNSIVSFLQNQVENIQSMFVSLGMVPFAVDKGANRRVMWLGLVDTAITLTTVAKQYYEFDMGTLNMADCDYLWSSGTALDFAPFSKLGIYLPFIGYQELNIDECRGTTISLKYKVDIMSGSCVAWVYIAGKPLYQFSGNCMTQIPLTGQDAQTLFTNAVNVGIAAAGAKTAGAVASAGDAATNALQDAGKISAESSEAQHMQHKAQVSNARGSLANATANGMMGMKPSYDKTGAIGASTSLLSVRQPYLFLTTPNLCLPKHYQRYCGFPSNITDVLGNFSGFTVVEDIRLNGLVATSPEVEEIYQLLKSGVII